MYPLFFKWNMYLWGCGIFFFKLENLFAKLINLFEIGDTSSALYEYLRNNIGKHWIIVLYEIILFSFIIEATLNITIRNNKYH